MTDVARRKWLQWFGVSAVGAAGLRMAHAQVADQAMQAAPTFTGPQANPYWGAVGPLATYPQKLPLIVVTSRPVQLETPRPYFLSALTPNAAFYVRWHLDGHPQSVDLKQYRLQVGGAAQRTASFSLADLLKNFEETSVVAVNQCSGNSRSKVVPRVPGSQWGHGAMGCARWTGVRLRDVLTAVSPLRAAHAVQFVGMERGLGPKDKGAFHFAKSLDLRDPVIDACILAYAMNGEPLPLLNGFPLRLIVPGFFATYWVKCVGAISLLDKPDDDYWMKTAYLIPDTPRGSVTPEQINSGTVRKVPLGRMPVRSLIIAPDGSAKIPAGLPVTVQGIAFGGAGGGIRRVEVSCDGGLTWVDAVMGEDFGPYAFRLWSCRWLPPKAGRCTLVVRATDVAGQGQSDAPFWNPSGYAYAGTHRQEVTVGFAG